ncbi:MAG: hypothetical protein AB7P76_07490 [Candidatus Melainabacteria bacterium]
MARSRNIKPAFFKNDTLAGKSPHARLLFIGLWTLADCEGRLVDRPTRIKGELFPYESVDVHCLLDELTGQPEPFIARYTVEGEAYIQVLNFSRHQSPCYKEKQAGSQLPPWDGTGTDPGLIRDQPGHNPEPIGDVTSTADILITDIPSTDVPYGDDSKESPAQVEREKRGKTGKFSEDGKQLTRELKDLLTRNGQTTFARDWLLTGYASADSVLRQGKKPDTIRQVMTWAVEQWACRASVTHFKHVANAFPHWERSRASTPAQPKAPDTSQRDRLLGFPYVRHKLTGEVFPIHALTTDTSRPGEVFQGSSGYAVAHLEGFDPEVSGHGG